MEALPLEGDTTLACVTVVGMRIELEVEHKQYPCWSLVTKAKLEEKCSYQPKKLNDRD